MPRRVPLSLANWLILHNVSRLDEQGWRHCPGRPGRMMARAQQYRTANWLVLSALCQSAAACPDPRSPHHRHGEPVDPGEALLAAVLDEPLLTSLPHWDAALARESRDVTTMSPTCSSHRWPPSVDEKWTSVQYCLVPFPRGVMGQAARDRLSALRFPTVSRDVACCSWLCRASIPRPSTVHAIPRRRICGV